MADKFKLCRCKQRRIPSDWPQCGSCHGGWVEREVKAEARERAERGYMIRIGVRAGLPMLPPPLLDAEGQELLLTGMVKRSQESIFLEGRARIQRAQRLRQVEINLMERMGLL